MRRLADRRAWTIALGAVVAAVALSAGFWFRASSLKPASDGDAVSALTRVELSTLSGATETLGKWSGKVLVVNFWATWCGPCREEIPGLMRLQSRFGASGIQIVGIAIDSADQTRRFVGEMGIAYPILIAGMDAMDIARRLGNTSGGLPYTVILDRRGKVVRTHLGLISEADLERILQPLAI
jgi:thiol-disulfide isomerase/thioredoxin